MSKRGTYVLYYDRFADKSIPRSTKHDHKKRNAQLAKKKPAQQLIQNITLEALRYHDNEGSISQMDSLKNETVLVNVSQNKKCKSASHSSDFGEYLLKQMCACTNINVGEIVLMCLNLAKKHSLTWDATLDIFEMLNCIFQKDILPNTKYTIRKLLQISNSSFTYHILCSNCNKYFDKIGNLKKNITCKCGMNIKHLAMGSFFIEINLEEQLHKLLSNYEVVKNIFYRFDRRKKSENALEDIFDGKVYKNMEKENLLGNKFNFSYTIDTDGCQASDSSRISIWPIYIMLHELPDNLRKKHMMLAGLWVAKQEPNMNIYLNSLVKQANQLSSKGIKWLYNGKEVVSKLFPLGCCVDSVARCAMLSMKKFNGIYGCTYCEHPTEPIDGVRKYPMELMPPRRRTDESIKQKMLLAFESDATDVTGVKGPSSLMNLKYFDLVNGMIVDFMHACVLGVTELYTTIVLTNAKEDYYVGSPYKLHVIDERLLSIRQPNCIAKVSRSIKERANWTASEWLSWLIFYSLICFNNILPKENYNNLAMYVLAMNTLLEDCITPEMLEDTRILLIRFVVDFERLYGKRYMHYNVHLLLHITESVKNWGPLYCVSAFPFENENNLLLRKKKCNYAIARQIVYRVLMYQQLPLLQQKKNIVSKRVSDYCNNLSITRLKNVCKVGDCTLIGNGKAHKLSDEELLLIQDIVEVKLITECTMFTNLIYNGCRYTTSKYHQRCQKTNNSVFQTKDDKLGIIRNIYKITYKDNYKVIIFNHRLTVENKLFNNDVPLSHYKSIDEKLVHLNAIEYFMLHRPSMIVNLHKKYFTISISSGMLGKHVN